MQFFHLPLGIRCFLVAENLQICHFHSIRLILIHRGVNILSDMNVSLSFQKTCKLSKFLYSKFFTLNNKQKNYQVVPYAINSNDFNSG